VSRNEAWRVDVGAAAATDLAAIIQWTAEQFGPEQARVHTATLRAALIALAAGPSLPGVKQRYEIGRDIGTFHVARNGRRGRHFILFRARGDEHPPVIELRILHDAMDWARHLRESGTEPDE
jgi:toxin ParE1/3/4